jgi:hypothetical protein
LSTRCFRTKRGRRSWCVVQPLHERQQAQRVALRAASSKVDFFTMVRGGMNWPNPFQRRVADPVHDARGAFRAAIDASPVPAGGDRPIHRRPVHRRCHGHLPLAD